MAVISRHRVAHGSDSSGAVRAVFYFVMALAAIAISVPAAIATVG